MNEFATGGPQQVFLSILVFGLLRTLMRASTRVRGQIVGRRCILKYNITVRAINFIFLILFLGSDITALWLLIFHYREVAVDKAALGGLVFFLFVVQALIAANVITIFGTRIEFDDGGVCRKVLIGLELRLPWTEILSYRCDGQIQVFGRGGHTISISRYRNGGEDLIAALRTHKIPSQ